MVSLKGTDNADARNLIFTKFSEEHLPSEMISTLLIVINVNTCTNLLTPKGMRPSNKRTGDLKNLKTTEK